MASFRGNGTAPLSCPPVISHIVHKLRRVTPTIRSTGTSAVINIIIVIIRTQQSTFTPHLLQLIGEVIFLGSASVSGLYYRIMSDAAHTRTVDGTRTGIEQRVKLECEREQQEQLLLSVIPAYIAAEVPMDQ